VHRKRTLAESLTPEESRQQLEEAERMTSAKSRGSSSTISIPKKQQRLANTTTDDVVGSADTSSRQNLLEPEKGKQTRAKKKTEKCGRPVHHKEDQPKLVIRKPIWMNNHSQEEEPAADRCLVEANEAVTTTDPSTSDGATASTGELQ